MRDSSAGMALLERRRRELAERVLADADFGAAASRDVESSASRFVDNAAELARIGTRELGNDQLLAVTTSLEVAQRHLDAARAHAHAALDATGTTVDATGHHTRAWLGAEHGLTRSEAARRVRVATKLRRYLPLVDAALSTGAITFDHARVLADLLNPRIADLLVEMQEALLVLSHGVRFERWASQVRDLLAAADVDGGHDPSPERNRLSLTDGLDGELFLNGTLVGDRAATLRHMLNARADQLFHRAKRDAAAAPGDLPLPSRAQLLAQALWDLCHQGTATRNSRTPAADVTLIVHAEDPSVARTPDGYRLTAFATRLLTCDAAFHTIINDRLGRPLDLADTARFATPDQRRAAAVRDGGCVFPGCDVPPSWCDLHHVTRWPIGPTDLRNLALLCRHHHGVTHRRGWTMTATDDQWFTWTTLTGTLLHSQRHGLQRAGP